MRCPTRPGVSKTLDRADAAHHADSEDVGRIQCCLRRLNLSRVRRNPGDSPAESPSTANAALPNEFLDASGSPLRVLVLPDGDHAPARCPQHGRRLIVAPLVRTNLRDPVPPILRWHEVVLRAAMPKASMHEHRNLRTREDEVGTAIEPLNRSGVNAIPEA